MFFKKIIFKPLIIDQNVKEIEEKFYIKEKQNSFLICDFNFLNISNSELMMTKNIEVIFNGNIYKFDKGSPFYFIDKGFFRVKK